MHESEWHIAMTFGLLLTSATIVGAVAQRLRLPKVTAYLLTGLVLGPYTVKSLPEIGFLPTWLFEITTIPESHLHFLDPLATFAMALVLFNMGCSFELSHFHSFWGRILRLSAGELITTFCLVAGVLFLIGESKGAAVLFGALALATAPATTVLVFKENRSEGPITTYANTLVAINNLSSIIVFEVLLAAILIWQSSGEVTILSELTAIVRALAGALVLGMLSGLVAAVTCSLLTRRSWLVTLVALATLVMGICQELGLPYLLAFLVMGATVANSSDRTRDIVSQLDELTGLLCVVFFVIHGAHLDIRALIAAGVVGLAYIVTRLVGKYLGIWLAAMEKDGVHVRRWLGATLMSQAGAAIALSSIAAQRHPELGLHVRDVILGTVVFFEIVGPIMIRQAVIRSGEVPMREAVRHQTSSIWDEVRAITNRLLMAFGLDPWKTRRLGTLRVSDLMRRHVKGIPASATFRRVVDHIEHSYNNTLPVVDADNRVVGIIRYLDLQGEHFDPGLGSLVCAEDLALSSFPKLGPDDALIDAWRAFQKTNDDCLPVVADDGLQQLLGVIRRRDVLRLTPSNPA